MKEQLIDKEMEQIARDTGMRDDDLRSIIENEKEWRVFLMAKITSIESKQGEMGKEIQGLNIKSGAWGILGGAFPMVTGIAIYLLNKSK